MLLRNHRLRLGLGISALAALLYSKNLIEPKLDTVLKNGPSLYLNDAEIHGRSLKRYSLGFSQAIGDLIWIRLLQKARVTSPDPGKVTWEFTQLDAITSLDPKFIIGYEFGSSLLSVFLRDNLGAKRILEKWVQQQPQNWKSHYHLGYHLFFEMGDRETAAKHMITASKLGEAPLWLSSLGVRLLSASGLFYQSLKNALSLYEQLPHPATRAHLSKRIESIVYAIQKKQWETALSDYQKARNKPPSRIEDLIPYVPNVSRVLAAVPENIPEEVAPLLSKRFKFNFIPGENRIVGDDSIPAAIKQFGLHIPKVYSPVNSTENKGTPL